MKMYMMVANSLESVDLLINKLKDDLVQAKFDKEKLIKFRNNPSDESWIG